MNKLFVVLLILFAVNVQAQRLLNFNKRYLDGIDQWVAVKSTNGESYLFGFIYIDNQFGLTMRVEGRFKIAKSRFIETEKNGPAGITAQLSPGKKKIAIIPESKYKELKIERYPIWLKKYEPDTTNVDRLFRLGFTYNEWDEWKKALYYLEKVQQINPNYEDLDYELAFAYNDHGLYQKALPILEKLVKADSTRGWNLKELSYTQIKLNQMDKAIETYKRASRICKDNGISSEIAMNLALNYLNLKDEPNFYVWAAEVEKLVPLTNEYAKELEQIKRKLKKQNK